MTVLHAVDTTPATCPRGRVRDGLEPVHHEWLRELRSSMQAAESHSDILARWRAIRYIDTVFAPRFERERVDIEELSLSLGSGQRRQLWAAGELVALSLWQLGHAVGLCHDGARFASTTDSLLRAVEYWFGSVEAIAGPMSWDDMPSEIHQDLASLANEPTPR